MPKRSLTGKPIAITGASSGIGRATAIACAKAGMPVALLARREDKLADLKQTIESQGGQAITVPGDVTNQNDCNTLIAETESAFGPLHAVYANAGFGFEKQTATLDETDFRDIFEVNFWGTLNTIRPALPGMTERGAGHILICSSCLSKIGLPYYGAYCATKAAQDHLARAMRHELAHTGVHVSSVHPIGTKTEFFETAQQRSGNTLRLMDRTKETFMQPPERVADAIVNCLRKPKGEVWTSLPTRLALATATALPGLADWGLKRMAAKRLSTTPP